MATLSCDCGTRFDVSDDLGGKTVACPACAKELPVPEVPSPPRAGRVGLSTAKYMTWDPGQDLTHEQIRRIAKRRSQDPVSKKRRNYSTVKFGVGSSLMVAAAYLMFAGGAYSVYIVMAVLLLVGVGFLINGLFEYLNTKAAEEEARQE